MAVLCLLRADWVYYDRGGGDLVANPGGRFRGWASEAFSEMRDI